MAKSRKTEKQQFQTENCKELFDLAQSYVSRIEEKTSQGCLVIWDKKRVLDGTISFSNQGVDGFGIVNNAGYTHFFGKRGDLINPEEAPEKHRFKFYMNTTKEAIDKFFTGLIVVDPSKAEKI